MPNSARRKDAAGMPPMMCAVMYPNTRDQGKLRLSANAKVTAGFKWAPLTAPTNIDDRHDHQARCDDLRSQGDRSAALGTDDPGPSRDDDEEECALGFCEKTPPLISRLQEIWCLRSVQHTVLSCRFGLFRVHDFLA